MVYATRCFVLLANRTSILSSEMNGLVQNLSVGLACAVLAVGHTVATAEVTIPITENHNALKNPFKGWRGVNDAIATGNRRNANLYMPSGLPHESMVKWYIGWDDLEQFANDGPDKIVGYMDHTWSGLSERNIKVIPRVVLVNHQGDQIPADLPPLYNEAEDPARWRDDPWYERPEVQRRIERLVERLGVAWDTDPRVAYVQVGIQGKYGEQWDLGQMPKVEDYLHKAFSSAFKNKKLMIRGGGTFGWSPSKRLAESGPYGLFEDSFGLDRYEVEVRKFLQLDGGERWKHAPMGGEVRFYKNPAMGEDINEALARPASFKELERWMRAGHTSHMGLENWTPIDEANQQRATELHKLMGYRFVITECTFDGMTEPGGRFKIGFTVRNDGASPFYYDWPVRICLVDPTTQRRVWSAIMTSANLREWLPAEDWNPKEGKYQSPALPYHVNQTFDLPRELPVGEYAVTVEVLDPEGGMTPSVRFAIANYWQGGLHPLGMVGVGRRPTSRLDAASFFTEGIDELLSYRVEPATQIKNVFTAGQNDGSWLEFAGGRRRSNRAAVIHATTGSFETLLPSLPEIDPARLTSEKVSRQGKRLDDHPEKLHCTGAVRDRLIYLFQLGKEASSSSSRFRLTLDLLQTRPDLGELAVRGGRYEVVMNGQPVGELKIQRDHPLEFLTWNATDAEAVVGANYLEIVGCPSDDSTGKEAPRTWIDQVVLDLELSEQHNPKNRASKRAAALATPSSSREG